MHKNKKGSLSLSMNAIVIVVLAFVMMGLGLTMTNMIFGIGTDGLSGIDLPKVTTPASAATPLSFQKEVVVKTGDSEPIAVGIYNTNNVPATRVGFGVANCISPKGSAITSLTFTSQVVSSIPASESAESLFFLNAIATDDTNTNPGTYTCELVAATGMTAGDQSLPTTSADYIESATITIIVTS